jgi:hypothetical protein
MQPMVRNAGESLGVSAELNLTDPSKGLYKSSVNVESLFEMEQMIKGDTPPNCEGRILGPQVAEMAGRYSAADRPETAAKGAELYKTHCQECHRPAGLELGVLRFQQQGLVDQERSRRADPEGREVPISHIGPIPRRRRHVHRTVAVPHNLGIKSSSFAFALGEVVEKTVNYVFDQKKPPVSPPTEADRRIYAERASRRAGLQGSPLNGVWATPPYLHNGSVPTIEDLLGRPEDRPKKFYLGNREYDPVKLGYKSDKIANGFEFDTSIRGNSNRARIQEGLQQGQGNQGVIGPALSAAIERH